MALAIIFESVGAGEWLVLLAVVLIVVGPKRLPATARKVGQHYSRFRRAAESFKRQLLEMDTEINNAVESAEKEVETAAKEVDQNLSPPDPSEYGGFDDGYADYGGYDPAEAYTGETQETNEAKGNDAIQATESSVKPEEASKSAASEV